MDTTNNISLARAFAHCASTSSYWICLISVFVLGVAGLLFINYEANKKDIDLDRVKLVWCIVFILLLFAFVFVRPEEISANTTIEQANRNVWIGY